MWHQSPEAPQTANAVGEPASLGADLVPQVGLGWRKLVECQWGDDGGSEPCIADLRGLPRKRPHLNPQEQQDGVAVVSLCHGAVG